MESDTFFFASPKKDVLSVVTHALEPHFISHFTFSMMHTHTLLCATAQLGHIRRVLESMLIEIIDGADVDKGCRECYR